ncbi:siderophore biosynthesis lipase/esterase [Apiospora phragmitis]|uniref:Siderophore biosynthesis lipase/esterase n=1 Tax=Apiospora phragmitis TaxID=2905665 RepID=A0ABR1TC28_9PEZI
MVSKFWLQGGLPGILHHYYTSQAVSQPHSVLFVGGLSDGLATTSYTADIIRALQPTPWSFFTLVLTSSYQGWGLSDLDRDTDEIAQCLRYIQDYKASRFGEEGRKNNKIVLMGHSTGSQCVLHYLYRQNPPGPLTATTV